MRRRAAAAGAQGFTLIEVLLATVLLAAGLAIAFSTLGAATQATRRGEALAERNERIRAVEGFLRKRIAAARPLAFATDDDTLVPQRFVGGPDRMQFVADLPDYLGHGGPYVHELHVAAGAGGDHVDLMLTLAVQQPLDVGVTADPAPPEPLARELQAVRFRYRALDAEGRPGEWREDWRAPDRLPLQVEITVRDAEGRDWPPLVVALPLAGTVTSALGEGL